jgi:hypothetical protein
VRIEQSIKADLANMKVAANPDTRGKTTTLVLNTKVLESKAQKLFGDAFHQMAFSARETRDGKVVFLYDKIKPKLILEKHMVTVLGVGPLPSTPKLATIVAGKEDHVYAIFHVPLPLEKKSIGDIWDAIGTAIDVEFNPAQMKLPLASQAAAAAPAASEAGAKKPASKKRK